MWQGMGRATRGMAACQLRNGTVVLGLLFLFAGDAAAQRFPRRPQRPPRPGMNRGAPAANPASSAPAANSNDFAKIFKEPVFWVREEPPCRRQASSSGEIGSARDWQVRLTGDRCRCAIS